MLFNVWIAITKYERCMLHQFCFQCVSGKHEMYSFKETSTCEYEVMVLSPLLCSHPDYRPESANEQHINCQPADKETSTKPQDLVRTEKENYKMLTKNKMYEADFFQGTKGPGNVDTCL